MKYISILFFFSFVILTTARAQLSRYIVQLTDKAATEFHLSQPSSFLSERALERRSRYQIAVDSADLPVPKSYIEQIQAIPNITVLNVSRWLNSITIQTQEAGSIAAINALPFVRSVSAVAARPAKLLTKFTETIQPVEIASGRPAGQQSNHYDYGGNAFKEIHLHQGEFLHNVGLRGQHMQLALLDGGFFHYSSLPAFDSMNANNQVLSTWDFVAREQSVVEDNNHGMMCLSTIAANIPGQFVGKAPQAMFHLFRTEDTGSEYPIEEFNWACGAERADSIGADIISSSLGYGYQFNDPVPDYPFSDLNGDITMAAKAADLAASKGIMVFNSAGNSGSDYWRKITTPADGDSVVAVGAVNSNGIVGAFSSYGPSADGRIKPDLASVGVATMVQTASGMLGTANGTSFSCPNLAGMAGCLWQGFPEFNNMRIIRALKEAGDRYTNPDDRTGYGIPDLKEAFRSLLVDYAELNATLNNCQVMVAWKSKDAGNMKYVIERKTNIDTGFINIAEIPAQTGDVLTNHEYELSDPLNNIPAGTVFYRIRQYLDTDPASLFSVYIDTVEVNINLNCHDRLSEISLVPNPVADNCTLVVNTGQPVSRLSILVFDAKGAMVAKLLRSKGAGQSNFQIPVQALSKGQYFIKVMDGDKEVGVLPMLRL